MVCLSSSVRPDDLAGADPEGPRRRTFQRVRRRRGNTAFGSKTGDVLTWTTSVLFGVFLLLAVALNLMANYRQKVQDDRAQARQAPPPIEPSPLTRRSH